LVVVETVDPADPLVVAAEPPPEPPDPTVVLVAAGVPPVVGPPVVAAGPVPEVALVGPVGFVLESSPAHAASVTRRTLGPRA
jgi:hypothetical protein